MRFSYQAVLLATLAFESALAQPSHRQVHQHKPRGLADVLGKRVDYSAPGTYLNPATGKAYTAAEWACLYADNNSNTAVKNGKTDAECQNIDTGSSTGSSGPAASAPAIQEKVANTVPKGPSSAPSSAASSASTGSTSSSGGSGSCVDISQVWKKGDGSKLGPTAADVTSGQWTDANTGSSKRATAAQDGYIGNTGTPYGSNIVPLSDCNNQDHHYSIKFTNKYADKRDMSVMIWNKVGADGSSQSGPFANSFFMVDLPAGKSAAFAFEVNSQIAFSEKSSTCQRQSGAPGGWYCIWGEANFVAPAGGQMSSWDATLMLDPAVPGDLTVSLPGQAESASSRSVCGFTNGGQKSAGEGTGSQCNPNTSGKANLEADFGL